jgi:hypothetical protein
MSRIPMHSIVPAFVGAGLLLATSAAGQETGSRFTLSPIQDGFLKLDSTSGVVSECKRDAAGYTCRLVPDERKALQGEVDRLTRENRELRDRLALGDTPAPGPEARPRSPMPPDEEVDRALGMMEKFIRRFMTILREEAPKSDKPI